MILDPTTAIVGTIAFALHVYGRYSERQNAEAFFPWLSHQVGYVLTSLAFCALGLLMQGEIMEPLGFTKPLTFAFVLCYGAGHLVSRVLGINAAAKARKA
jgi:hypothetical protein